jgi:DNA-binding CsgD family transcriptional regulator
VWLVGTSDVPGNLPFRLEVGEFIVGRTKRAQIVIVDATVSRRHARLVNTRGALRIEDLKSLNGTHVNECPITQCELRVGDHVRFGNMACAVSSSPLSIPTADDEVSTFQVRKEFDQTTRIDTLTEAQSEIAKYVIEGYDEAQIASLLGKSPHTIHTHLKAMFQRLGVHSRADLILRLLKRK